MRFVGFELRVSERWPGRIERHGNVDPSFVTGIASLGDRMLIVMDIESLLSSDEIGLVTKVANR